MAVTGHCLWSNSRMHFNILSSAVHPSKYQSLVQYPRSLNSGSPCCKSTGHRIDTFHQLLNWKQKENEKLVRRPTTRKQKENKKLVRRLTVMILNPYPNFLLFSTIYFALSVTRLPLVPSRAARTVTKSPDKVT